MDRETLEREVNLLHKNICSALSDPKRIMILYVLSEKGRFVNEIAEVLDIPQPTVSRHLRVLRDCELVETQREGTSVFYTLADKRIITALDTMRGILTSQLEAQMNLAKNFGSEK